MKKTATLSIVSGFFLSALLLLGAASIPTPSHGQTFAVPSVPLNVTAVAGDGNAVISFYPPSDTGGAPLTGYIISPPAPLASQTVPASANSYTFVGLTNGTAYTFSVAAQNSAGTGPYGSAAPVTPTKGSTVVNVVPPGSPTNVSAVAGNAQAVVTFSPPSDTGGAPIDSYTVISSNNTRVTGSASPLTITGLTNDAGNNIYVVAHNAKGDSVPSNTVSVHPSSTATNPVTPAASEQVTLKLDNPLKGVSDLPGFAAKVLGGAVLVLTPIVTIMLLYAGFLFVSAQGNAEKLGEAKKVLLYTLIGAAIVLCAQGLAIVVSSAVGCIAGASGCS